MSRPMPVRICKIRKSPVKWRQLVYHWLVQKAPASFENMDYFRQICYQNSGEPYSVPPPDSALDPWGALETGWPDRMENEWPSNDEVAASEAKPANNVHAAYTNDETETQEPDSTHKQ